MQKNNVEYFTWREIFLVYFRLSMVGDLKRLHTSLL